MAYPFGSACPTAAACEFHSGHSEVGPATTPLAVWRENMHASHGRWVTTLQPTRPSPSLALPPPSFAFCPAEKPRNSLPLGGAIA
jgi:hypothetical protein